MSQTPLAEFADLAAYLPQNLGQAAKGAIPVYVGPGNGYNGSAWTVIGPGPDTWALATSSQNSKGVSYNPANFGGGIVDNSVDLRNRKRTAQPRGMAWSPTAAVAETCSRTSNLISFAALSSGTLLLVGGCIAQRSVPVNHISFISATAGSSLTHQWAIITDQAGNVLAKSADLTSTAWAANAVQTFTLPSAWTPLADTAIYIGLVVVGTVPNLFANTGFAGFSAMPPPSVATGGSGYTDPTSLGASVPSITGTAISAVYAYLS